jgi:HicB family
MPRALHAELTGAAEREGVSLNQFITSTLATAVGLGGGDGAVERPVATPTSRHARLVVVALFANVVVIGLAAIAAIAVLLLAWRG